MALDSDPLKQRCFQEGFFLAGVADVIAPPHLPVYEAWVTAGMHAEMEYLKAHIPLKQHPTTLLEDAQSLLVVGLNYAQPVEQPELGKIAMYAQGRDYHKVIRQKLSRVSDWLIENVPEIRTRVCVDSAPIMERDFAQLAGLGWFGKNTCLINSARGSFFFLGVLLMSEKFAADEPAIGGCGSCRLCIDACPTGALVFRGDAKVALLDSNRCISYLTIEQRGELSPEQAGMLNGWMFGCDVCQTVCPFNERRDSQPMRASVSAESDFESRFDGMDANWVLDASDEEVLLRIAGTPLMRAGVEQLRRNARVVLGK